MRKKQRQGPDQPRYVGLDIRAVDVPTLIQALRANADAMEKKLNAGQATDHTVTLRAADFNA